MLPALIAAGAYAGSRRRIEQIRLDPQRNLRGGYEDSHTYLAGFELTDLAVAEVDSDQFQTGNCRKWCSSLL
jgi:hypothetical protein